MIFKFQLALTQHEKHISLVKLSLLNEKTINQKKISFFYLFIQFGFAMHIPLSGIILLSDRQSMRLIQEKGARIGRSNLHS